MGGLVTARASPVERRQASGMATKPSQRVHPRRQHHNTAPIASEPLLSGLSLVEVKRPLAAMEEPLP